VTYNEQDSQQDDVEDRQQQQPDDDAQYDVRTQQTVTTQTVALFSVV